MTKNKTKAVNQNKISEFPANTQPNKAAFNAFADFFRSQNLSPTFMAKVKKKFKRLFNVAN